MRPIAEPTYRVPLSLTVNGETVTQDVEARRSLADFLREDLRLTGTHLGCEQGVCGSCTVLVNGEPARSCLMLAAQADESEITTVEGISSASGLSELQTSFKKHHALQCGFCTPGFLMTISGVESSDYPDRESVRALLSGNICRCTGYGGIVDAVADIWDLED